MTKLTLENFEMSKSFRIEGGITLLVKDVQTSKLNSLWKVGAGALEPTVGNTTIQFTGSKAVINAFIDSMRDEGLLADDVGRQLHDKVAKSHIDRSCGEKKEEKEGHPLGALAARYL